MKGQEQATLRKFQKKTPDNTSPIEALTLACETLDGGLTLTLMLETVYRFHQEYGTCLRSRLLQPHTLYTLFLLPQIRSLQVLETRGRHHQKTPVSDP